MVRFYDARDETEFSSISSILKAHGIEFTAAPQPQPGIGRREILVAEEDLPFAEELVRTALQELRH